MFADDIALCAEMAAKYKPQPPFVECGGIESPCVADYRLTIEAMKTANTADEIRVAQMARYLNLHRPLEASFPGYVCEDPATGGLPIERLFEKYDRDIGTAVLLSVLEHVSNPFDAAEFLWDAMASRGLAIVSVPFMFPEHHGPEDCFRFTPTGLRHVFGTHHQWDILEVGWRLKIPADAGVLEIHTGEPQAIETCYIVARAR